MLTATKVHELAATEITAADIEEILTSGQAGVCRAIITPEAAEVLLQNHNMKNRGFKKHQINFLKGQIAAGKFVFNGETIVVGDNMQILNGQHRLSACAQSDVPIETYIVFGVPAASFVTLDQGARRRSSDVLQIEGHKSSIVLAGCLRQIDNYFKDSIGRARPNGPAHESGHCDNAYALELLSLYPKAEESVAKTAGIKLTSPSLCAALHYLFSLRDQDAADCFCHVVRHGFQIDHEYDSIGQAAGMLREWLIRASMGNSKKPPHVIANIWIKAWNAGRSGVLPKVLIWKDGVEKQVEIL